jgi:hypothetical protein
MKNSDDSISFVSIAERFLYYKNADGEKKEVILRIGAPYKRGDSPDFACPVEIIGITGRTRDIIGIDAIHALELALKFAQSFIDEPGVHERLVWPDGQQYEPM